MVVCNHVLEHVEDARIAMRQLHRVLKVGGRAICQTPYASRLSKTLEEPLFQTSEDRVYFYGQDDHVRLFGLDIEQKLKDAGVCRPAYSACGNPYRCRSGICRDQ